MILIAVVLCGLMPAGALASNDATLAANTLYDLGLFVGNGIDENGNPNFDLNKTPTRYEIITMLVRLLGKAEEAEQGAWNTPFTDVATWAQPYVGYAYANGLTAGTTNTTSSGNTSTTFGGNTPATSAQYLTFVLRALGYSDTKGDFTWNTPWTLSDDIGLTSGEYDASTNSFTRGDMVSISRQALNCKYNDGSSMTLLEILADHGAVDGVAADKILGVTDAAPDYVPNFTAYKKFPDVPDYGYYLKGRVEHYYEYEDGYVYDLYAMDEDCKLDYIKLLQEFGFKNVTDLAYATNKKTGRTQFFNEYENPETGTHVYIGLETVNDVNTIYLSIGAVASQKMLECNPTDAISYGDDPTEENTDPSKSTKTLSYLEALQEIRSVITISLEKEAQATEWCLASIKATYPSTYGQQCAIHVQRCYAEIAGLTEYARDLSKQYSQFDKISGTIEVLALGSHVHARLGMVIGEYDYLSYVFDIAEDLEYRVNSYEEILSFLDSLS